MGEIQLEQVTKRFPDGTEAVRGIDLTIADGELMILVGPSGCGKTTALRMIAGLEEITSGTLRIGGEVVNDLAPKRRDIAMVFQSYALYPHMTVAQNMGFALKLAKVDRAEVQRRVEKAAAVLDLQDHLERKPANLSGGQRQRVAMGRAIVRDPQAFLMDEPLSNLDAKLRVQMRVEVARLQQRLGTTMVYVTHDQTEAMTLGHRVAVMRGGNIQQVDVPQHLYEAPANTFVAGFIGSPPMNLLPGRLTETGLELPLGPHFARAQLKNAWPDTSTARDVIVGVRPEAFSIGGPGAGEESGSGFEICVDVVEAMGAELYVYFDVACPTPIPAHLADSVERVDGSASTIRGAVRQTVARLPSSSGVAVGDRLTLRVDPASLAIFDMKTGNNVATHRAAADVVGDGARSHERPGILHPRPRAAEGTS